MRVAAAMISSIARHAARRDDPVLTARFVWALVHGTAMLVID
jgi:hypothetical protein